MERDLIGIHQKLLFTVLMVRLNDHGAAVIIINLMIIRIRFRSIWHIWIFCLFLDASLVRKYIIIVISISLTHLFIGFLNIAATAVVVQRSPPKPTNRSDQKNLDNLLLDYPWVRVYLSPDTAIGSVNFIY